MTMTKKTMKKAWNNVFSILIDLALIGFGLLLYYHFEIQMLAPIDLHPVAIDLFGGNKQLAVLVIAGLPFAFGMYDLIRTIVRMTRPSSKADSKPS